MHVAMQYEPKVSRATPKKASRLNVCDGLERLDDNDDGL